MESRLAIPSHWRRFGERYRLQGIVCKSCGRAFFPVRSVCPYCRRKGKVEVIEFSGRGEVYSYTVVRSAPAGFEVYTPYIVGLVKLEEGPLVISQIVDCDPEEMYIGAPVEACFRRIRAYGSEGIVCYGFKFRPRQDGKRKAD